MSIYSLYIQLLDLNKIPQFTTVIEELSSWLVLAFKNSPVAMKTRTLYFNDYPQARTLLNRTKLDPTATMKKTADRRQLITCIRAYCDATWPHVVEACKSKAQQSNRTS